MTNEIRELMAKADSGDAESKFYVARAYAFGESGLSKDVPAAIKLFNEISNEIVAASFNLIGIYMGQCGSEYRNAKGVIDSFQLLIDVFNGARAMVSLGAIYCGSPYNRHISADMGGLPELADYYNPQKGFALIEQGLRRGEEMEADYFSYSHFEEVAGAYLADTTRVSGGKPKLWETPYYKGLDFTIALARKAVYEEKCVNALETGNHTLPQDVVDNYLSLARIKKSEAQKELESIITAEVSRSSSQGSTKEYLDKCEKALKELMESGIKADLEAAMLIFEVVKKL